MIPLHKNLLGLILVFIAPYSFAQQTDTLKYYLDGDYKPIEKKESAFILKVYKERPTDRLWKREIFTYVDGKHISSSHSVDSLGQTLQGEYSFYSYNNELIKTGHYENGKRVGEWTDFSTSGKKMSSYIFIDGKMAGLSKEWYENGKLSDSFNVDKNGNGPGLGFYASGRKRYEGLFANGVKQGPWKYYYDLPDSPQSMEAFFEKDSLTATKCFTAGGGKQNQNCHYFKEASFADGDRAWINYLIDAITNSKFTKYLKNGGKYTVVVDFVISKEGTVKDIKVENPRNDKLDNIAQKIIRNSPPWEPAIQYNQAVNAYRRQPITFLVEIE